MSIAKSDITRFGGTTANVGKVTSSGAKSIPAYSSILILNFLSPVSIFNFAYTGKLIVIESPTPNIGIVAIVSITNEGVLEKSSGSSHGFSSLAGLRPSLTIFITINPFSLPSRIWLSDCSTKNFSTRVKCGGGRTHPHITGDIGPSSPSASTEDIL